MAYHRVRRSLDPLPEDPGEHQSLYPDKKTIPRAPITDPLSLASMTAQYSPIDTHLKTYTAGEDSSRLAAAAKELGLQQARQPRRQVRSNKPNLQRRASWLLGTTTEDARIRSVYSSHVDDDHDFFVSPEWEALEAVAEEPPTDGHEVTGGNLTAAVLGIIKGMVGPAILYLPHGFAHAGYVTALPMMVVCTVLFLYSSSCLLESWKFVQQQQQQQQQAVDDNNDKDTERAPLVGALSSQKPKQQKQKQKQRLPLSYPELSFRALGTRGESLVKTGIALMQSGVCLTYLIFVPQNLHTSLLILTGWNVPPTALLLVMVVIEVPLSWLRDIRKLTPTNLLANVLILYGLLVCLGFAIQTATTAEPGTSAWHAVSVHWKALQPFAEEWYLFIGTSVLLFEGSITLLVPLQEAVHTDEQRAQFPTVYKRVILGIIVFYAFFGITNWMAFGNSVRTVLTTSLPAGPVATTVQLAYSVAVIFTFPLQNFPALEITCRTISNALSSSRGSSKSTTVPPWWTRRNVISSCLVCLLAIVAVCTMESLDKVVSLMGSLLGCPIAFVFPPLIHSQLVRPSRGRLWGNRLVATLGLVAMVLASITTLLTW